MNRTRQNDHVTNLIYNGGTSYEAQFISRLGLAWRYARAADRRMLESHWPALKAPKAADAEPNELHPIFVQALAPLTGRSA